MLAFLAFAAALPLGPPAHLPPERNRRTYEAEVAGGLARCGIGRRQIRTAYQADLQDYSVTIRGSAAGFSDAALSCVAEAEIRGGLFTRFADRRAQARYEAFTEAAVVSLARAWLEARGRLDDLPVYDPQRHTPATFAAAIETFCGVAPGSFFATAGDVLTIASPESSRPVEGEQFGCLINALLASDLSKHGLAHGYLGNEAVAVESGGPER
jgi:hypothetical protein